MIIMSVQDFEPLIMWQGSLATSVCLCRHVTRTLERKGCGEGVGMELAERARRRLEDTGTMVIREQTVRRTKLHVDSDCRIRLTTPDRASTTLGPANQLLW